MSSLDQTVSTQNKRIDMLKDHGITEREKDIIGCMIEGLNNNEISEKLFISKNTVKRHIQNIYEKLNIENKIKLFNILKIKN